MKKIFTLFAAALVSMSMWADAVVNLPTDLSVLTRGYSYSYSVPAGVLEGNKIYFSSYDGKIEGGKINPYRAAFVFKPTIATSLAISFTSTTNSARTNTATVYQVNDTLFDVYQGTDEGYLAAYIAANYSEEDLTGFWKDAGVTKLSSGNLIFSGDSAKILTGYTPKEKLLGTALAAHQTAVAGRATVVDTIQKDNAEMVFEAGKPYLIFCTVSSSSGLGLDYLSFSASCTAPAQALVLAADKTEGLYVGDTVTFTISGGNGAATTLAGAANEVITANQWIATAGEHTFTLSQDLNDGVCGGEDQVVLTVAEKTPVTAAAITGIDKAYVGDEVTLTCVAANATTFQWYQGANAISGATEATYKFTPDAAGEYTFACEAGNEFTATPVRSADFKLTVTVRPPEAAVVFHWQFDGETTDVDVPAVATGGTVTLGTTDSGKSWGTESLTFDASVPDDMKVANKGLKSGGNALFIKIDLTNGIEEGDTIFLSGYKVWDFGTTQGANDIVDDLNTGTESKSEAKMGYAIVPDGISANTIYVMRGTGSSMSLAAIKIVRPADVGGDPVLKVSTNSATVKATAAEPTATAKVVFSGKHLTPGTYNFALTQVEGLSVSPASVTVPENGKFSQEVTITFAATKDVSMSMAELSLTINDIKQSVLISYSASMTKNYGKSIDFEQFVVENGVNGDFATALAAGNYIASLSGFSLDSLNSEKEGNNEPYLGLKIKAANAYVGCWLQKGDTISIKFGKVSANVEFTAGEQSMTKTPDDLMNPFEFIAADADTYVKLQTTSGEAVVIKHILIAGEKHEDQAITNVDAATKAVKVLRNGQLLIIRGDKTYTLTGMEL